MFDNASLDHAVDKARWKAEEPVLREALLAAQYDLLQRRKFPVLILIGGVEASGKGETIHQLNEWLDPRHVITTAFGPLRDEEIERPSMWRFWRALPPKGKIGVFFGAWHTNPILDRVFGRIDEGGLERAIAGALAFERMLSDEGVLILKFWLHLTKKQQKKRLQALADDPMTAWRVAPRDWEFHEQYNQFLPVCETYLRRTSTGHAPWFVVPGADERYRHLFVGRTLLASLRERLDAPEGGRVVDRTPALAAPVDGVNVIRALTLNQPMEEDEYDEALAHWQGRLALLSRHKRFERTSVVVVFEGNDAAGKGGALRRVTNALDARIVKNVSIAAPTEEERDQPYLWRFWRHLPHLGRFVLFDRSWYGRVLVERVEKFCAEQDWMRAYGEIVDFESQLVEHGFIVAKLWLAVSQDEQLRRFQEREQVKFKQFKITPEDWRNREKWDAYERAVCDMVERTSTAIAPWTLVEADNKRWARVKVVRTLVEAIERRIGVDSDKELARLTKR